MPNFSYTVEFLLPPHSLTFAHVSCRQRFFWWNRVHSGRTLCPVDPPEKLIGFCHFSRRVHQSQNQLPLLRLREQLAIVNPIRNWSGFLSKLHFFWCTYWACVVMFTSRECVCYRECPPTMAQMQEVVFGDQQASLCLANFPLFEGVLLNPWTLALAFRVQKRTLTVLQTKSPIQSKIIAIS